MYNSTFTYMVDRLETAIVRSILAEVEQHELDGLPFGGGHVAFVGPELPHQHGHRDWLKLHVALCSLEGQRGTQLVEPLCGYLRGDCLDGFTGGVRCRCDEISRLDALDVSATGFGGDGYWTKLLEACCQSQFSTLVACLAAHIVDRSAPRYLACALWRHPANTSSASQGPARFTSCLAGNHRAHGTADFTVWGASATTGRSDIAWVTPRLEVIQEDQQVQVLKVSSWPHQFRVRFSCTADRAPQGCPGTPQLQASLAGAATDILAAKKTELSHWQQAQKQRDTQILDGIEHLSQGVRDLAATSTSQMGPLLSSRHAPSQAQHENGFQRTGWSSWLKEAALTIVWASVSFSLVALVYVMRAGLFRFCSGTMHRNGVVDRFCKLLSAIPFQPIMIRITEDATVTWIAYSGNSIYASLRCHTLLQWQNSWIHPSQFAFCKGRSTTSLNSHLSFDLLQRFHSCGSFAGIQLDFAKCFDSIPYIV